MHFPLRFYEPDGSPRPHASSCRFRHSPRVDPTGGSTAFQPSKFQIDSAGALNKYKEWNIYHRASIIGPVYPIDAFSLRDSGLLRSGMKNGLLRAHRIRNRAYATELDIDAFMAWTGEVLTFPERWEDDLEVVTAALDGIDGLQRSDRAVLSLPTLPRDRDGQLVVPPRAARTEVSGPITSIQACGNAEQQVLSWCARDGLIPAMVLDGIMHFGYFDVYSTLLTHYFHDDYDRPEVWDDTYAVHWSARKRSGARWVLPRGFKEAVRSDMFPSISLCREETYVKDDGAVEARRVTAAYPVHVADRAAEMFRAVYRQDGFAERFRQWRYTGSNIDSVHLLSGFSIHEAEWIRTFAAESGVQIWEGQDGEYVLGSDLIYYNLFAAKAVEDEIDIDPEPNAPGETVVMVMFDGTFCRGGPFGPWTPLRRKRDIGTDR